ncbi:protein kinase [Pseudomonas sp. Z5-35]|uniref:serine/threonine protein kinase n=1 Tax=unclassified Pseudomonas TaxID=196821 RepID=UPI003DA7F6A3
MSFEFETGDLIDDRYKVRGLCSDSGGMGQILFVEDTEQGHDNLVLKYCREEGEEYIKRFRREVRLLESFAGNSKVVSVVDSNVYHEPPYFVMEHYSDGDLTTLIDELVDDPGRQESIFNQMIDCVAELHSKGVFHRDIKPQNFLIGRRGIVVSDFGLGMEPDSSSRFTSSSMFWGTQGYLPPEFESGGFKAADAAGDIFMLGKSIYVLLTKQNPTYLMDGGMHPAIFYVIERACELDKRRRYQSLAEMKQALQMAYDVIIGRGGRLGEVNQLISTITDRLENENKFSSLQVIDFIDGLGMLDDEDKIRLCLELKSSFISLLVLPRLVSHVSDFLKIYRLMVEDARYSWAFAEDIARNMKVIFEGEDVSNRDKAKALELAVESAYRMNRFAAMNTCVSMIISVDDEALGMQVVAVMQRNQHEFLEEIEASQCKSTAIRKYLNSL